MPKTNITLIAQNMIMPSDIRMNHFLNAIQQADHATLLIAYVELGFIILECENEGLDVEADLFSAYKEIIEVVLDENEGL